MPKPKLIIFASGSKEGGGSGFENLVKARDRAVLDADIVAVVSNHENGGVRARAEKLGVSFVHFPKPWDAESYQRIVHDVGAEWVALSGWLKLVVGLNPRRTFNIHPALLSQLGGRFGGPGMYGHHVHEAVKAALDAREVTESGFTMHFVTEDGYDRGPVFAEVRTGNFPPWMTADDIGARVNVLEHRFQPLITNMVVHGEITWDGKNPQSLVVPGDLHKRLDMI